MTRIAGDDRYETAAKIAAEGAKGGKPAKVILASGESFADALAVSPIAYAKKYPIILTEKDSTSSYSTKALSDLGVSTRVLVGGESVVSKSVETALSSTTRVSGADRAVTANLVADWATKDEGFKKDSTILVGGTNSTGADSLVASALGGKNMINLHFAGWDATSVFLKEHSAELTGKGYIFGGDKSVTADQVSAANTASQTVAAASPFIVTNVTNKATGGFKYVDASKDKEIAVTFGTTDAFTVGGTTATIATFRAALTAGDTVEVLPDTPAKGQTTFKLVNKDDVDYASGLVGGTITSSQLQILEPTTVTVLNTVDTTGSYTIYTVDGVNVSASLFNAAVSAGDTVKITGTGASATTIRTIALTNGSVSGKVTALSGANFAIQGAKGAPLGVFTAASSGDTLSVDGVTKVQADFNAALSNGDTVTFAKNGGVQTIALTNAAPQLSSGQVSGAPVVTAGQLVSLPYVPAGLAATTAAPLVIGVTTGQTTNGAVGTAEVDTLTFASLPYGNVSKLSFKLAGSSGITALNNQIITVSIPNTGSASADATTLAGRIQTAIQGLTGGTSVASTATVAASGGNLVFTITYGSGVMNDLAEATSVTPLDVTVNGAVATVDEAVTALTRGDSLKYQAADLQSKATSRLEITDAKYSGVVVPSTVVTTGSSEAVQVYADASTTVALGSVFDFTSVSGAGLTTGTSAQYVVNGSTATSSVTAFKSALDSIKNGVLKGTLTVSQTGLVTTYSLTTTNL